jgi:hypothetical protein
MFPLRSIYRCIFLGLKGGQRVRLTNHGYLKINFLERLGASTSHYPVDLYGH